MSSGTTVIAEQCRIQEWAAQIRDCQIRPIGMSVVSWCACHGITKTKYFYRPSRVRAACLEAIREEMPVQPPRRNPSGWWSRRSIWGDFVQNREISG